MILDQTFHFKFNKTVFKIHYFHYAFNHTLVFVGLKDVGDDYLVHMDTSGKILFQVDFKDFVDTMVMLNDREVGVLRVQLNQVWIINLFTKTIDKYFFQFKIDVSCQCYMEYFCETGLLCIREHGDNDETSIKFTYLAYPFQLQTHTHQEPTPIQYAVYNPDTSQKKWTPSYTTRKVNSHSKYMWCESRHKDQFVVRCLHIEQQKTLYRELTVKMSSLYEMYGMNNMEAAIIQMWEIRENEYLLYTATNKNEKAVNKDCIINNTFIWNETTNIIRESKFSFDKKYHDLQIDLIGTPTFSMFRTFYFQSSGPQIAPAYFVNNNTQEICHQEAWVCSHMQKYTIPDYLTDTIVQGYFDNGQVKQLSLRVIKMAFRQQMAIFFLLNSMNGTEDWDENLLSDIAKVIDNEHFD